MAWSTMTAIFFIMWWTVLFVVLPWGVRPQAEDDMVPGTDPGAPAAPALLRKLIWTTGLTAILFGLFYAVYVSRIVTVEALARWLRLVP